MPRTIAFTSCMDTVNYPRQDGWRHLAAHAFDTLVLLGDSIYMDYGRWPGNHNRPKDEGNGTPKGLPLADFSDRMHRRYKAQFELRDFHDLVTRPGLMHVHAIWDDHDFAWNNARGAGPDTRDELVSPAVRRLSRLHFGIWLTALRGKLPSYPANPVPDGIVAEDGGSIAESMHLAGAPAMLHMTDGRSFREAAYGSLLGADQVGELTALFAQKDQLVHVVGTGTDLDNWSQYEDVEWLKNQSEAVRILVLSGDVHRPKFRNQDVGRIFEATASAMAQGPTWGPKRDQVYGLVTIDDAVIDVRLFEGPALYKHRRIDIARWTLL